VRDVLGVKVLDAVIVNGGRWWFLDEDLHAEGSHWFAGKLDSRAPSADLVGMRTRQDLVASIAAPVGQREDELLQCFLTCLDRVNEEEPGHAGQMVLDLMEAWRSGYPPSDADYLTAGLSMSTGKARDEVWRTLTRLKAEAYLPFWVQVLARTPRGVRTVALGVTAMVAWIAGNGALMNICVHEAEQTDPNFPLVCLLRGLCDGFLEPKCWEEVVDSMD
jgi:hypothetical protein